MTVITESKRLQLVESMAFLFLFGRLINKNSVLNEQTRDSYITALSGIIAMISTILHIEPEEINDRAKAILAEADREDEQNGKG